MVEQWTENPCVPGSIPGGTTKPTLTSGFFVFISILSYNQFKLRGFFATDFTDFKDKII